MSPLSEQSYYEILEVTPQASRDDITRAYHRSKSAYSTSSPALYSVFSKEEATEILKLIDEAYSVLINQDQRRSYDQRLAGKDKREGFMDLKGGELPDFAPPTAPTSPHPSSHSVTTVRSNRPVTGPRAVVAPTSRSPGPEFARDDKFEREIEAAENFDGAFLARIREYKNVTIEQISDLTRVGKHYLRALEKNDVKALPATVFVRGFIVQYAKALGLDEKKIADSYMRILKVPPGKSP